MRAADRTEADQGNRFRNAAQDQKPDKERSSGAQGAHPGPTIAARNDILPSLHLTNLTLGNLRAPAREIRKVPT